MSEMYRQAVEAQSRPGGGQHPYLPFPWAGDIHTSEGWYKNGNNNGNVSERPTYLTLFFTAARGVNGLPGNVSQASGAGGVGGQGLGCGVQGLGGRGQGLHQGRHGIVDPGLAASHKGRSVVLDPAGEKTSNVLSTGDLQASPPLEVEEEADLALKVILPWAGAGLLLLAVSRFVLLDSWNSTSLPTYL